MRASRSKSMMDVLGPTTSVGVLSACLIVLVAGLIGAAPRRANAQVPVAAEVRQIVTFSFLPGKFGQAMDIYLNQAVPLYELNRAMRSIRGFREVESPIPLDLMFVSAFDGMAGMDVANSALRGLAADAGTSIGAIYGSLSALTSGHTDQFIEMLPSLGAGDPSVERLTAFVWYRVPPGRGGDWEHVVESELVPWEASAGVPASTGRFLLSDGWHYLRILGFESLGDYQRYWSGPDMLDSLTVSRREVISSSIADLSIR